MQRATRNLEKDVERLTGERDAATAARAAAEERLQAATPSKKDRARAPWTELEGVRSELDNSQAARAARCRELQRGIRRVRASRFWFQDDPASLVFRDVAAALGRGLPGGGALPHLRRGRRWPCVYCGHPRDAPRAAYLGPRRVAAVESLVPPPSPDLVRRRVASSRLAFVIATYYLSVPGRSSSIMAHARGHTDLQHPTAAAAPTSKAGLRPLTHRSARRASAPPRSGLRVRSCRRQT